MTEKTIQYAFDTRITNLATNTTLGTATRHDFSAVTLEIPENSSRSFLSVVLHIGFRDAFTTATNITGWRLGIKLGAVAFDDLDVSITQSGTGDHERFEVIRDVTTYFNTNFGAGTSQTCQAGIAVSTAAASNISGIVAKLLITYEYNDTGQTTQVKTVIIPIQSHHTLLGTSHTEIGTTGGTTDAPANQIPALDTYLPEASKSYKQAFIEMFSNDLSGASTSDITVFYQVDSTTEVQRATSEEALGTSTYFHDIYIYPTGTHATNSAHAFSARTDVASRMQSMGGWLVVTYTYNASTSTSVMNQVLLPLNQSAGQSGLTLNASGSAADANVYTVEVDIQEPGTITIAQSAVMGWFTTNGTTALSLAAGSQTERTYTIASNVPYVGPTPVVHRVAHSSGWTLARGKNTLLFKARQSINLRASLEGYIILSYTSSIAATGLSTHNRTTTWYVFDANAAAATSRDISSSEMRVPKINATNYVINGIHMDYFVRNSNSQATYVQAQIQSGEWSNGGWLHSGGINASSSNEMCFNYYCPVTLSWYNQRSDKTGYANIETARAWRTEAVAASIYQAIQNVSYHNITYTASGTVSGYTGNGSGISVDVYRADTDEKIATVTTSVGGGYSATVFDNTCSYYAAARQDATHVGRSDDGTI